MLLRSKWRSSGREMKKSLEPASGGRGEEMLLSCRWCRGSNFISFTVYLQGFGSRERTRLLVISCPSSPGSWNCKMNTRLGTVFPLFSVGSKIDACCRHSCSLDCIFQPWGLLLYPWEDSIVESYWELCPGILPELTYLLFSSLESLSTSLGAVIVAPLCGWNPTCML